MYQRPFFLLQQAQRPAQQWGCPNRRQNHQIRHFIRRQGQAWRPLYKFPQIHPRLPHAHRDGTSVATYANANRQHHVPRIVNNTIAPRWTKDMGISFHWLRCREAQQQFLHEWRPGPTNNDDYVTKHHAAIHHRAMRTIFLTPKRTLDDLHQKARDEKKYDTKKSFRRTTSEGTCPTNYIHCKGVLNTLCTVVGTHSILGQ